MAGFKLDDERAFLSEINITPFVDVMLVLLIIFMVTAPLLESGIPIQLPKASAKALPKSDEPTVTISLNKDSRLFVNQEEVSYQDLTKRLKAMYQRRKRKEIFIRADGSLPYALVAQTMANVKLAGIDKIGLVTLPPEESK